MSRIQQPKLPVFVAGNADLTARDDVTIRAVLHDEA
jgi:hypothetical protein